MVSDNLKSGITKACVYEPEAEMAAHYDTAIVPARPKVAGEHDRNRRSGGLGNRRRACPNDYQDHRNLPANEIGR